MSWNNTTDADDELTKNLSRDFLSMLHFRSSAFNLGSFEQVEDLETETQENDETQPSITRNLFTNSFHHTYVEDNKLLQQPEYTSQFMRNELSKTCNTDRIEDKEDAPFSPPKEPTDFSDELEPVNVDQDELKMVFSRVGSKRKRLNLGESKRKVCGVFEPSNQKIYTPR